MPLWSVSKGSQLATLVLSVSQTSSDFQIACNMSDQLAVVTSQTRQFTQEELSSRSDLVQLEDVQSSRTGLAVPVSALLGAVELNEGDELVLTSSADGFCATLPLAAAAKVGLIWFAGTDGPLTKEQGGPFRFFIPNAAECKTAVLDNCANVKFVDRIEVRQKD